MQDSWLVRLAKERGISMRIGIIGGGLMGLALAHRLSAEGHAVTVFERDQQLGGLATHHDYGPFTWDRFYHVILPSDRHLIGFLTDIGLGQRLRWARTRTGFYVDEKLYSVSNNLELLKFPLVGLWGNFDSPSPRSIVRGSPTGSGWKRSPSKTG